MNSTTKKVLAIGLDAAAPAFVRQLIEEGQLPNLQTLLSKGRWMRVQSTAYIGSGSVWPTFITGRDATEHGVYGEWVWQPQQMDVTRYSGNSLPPFWKDFEKQGLTVGILDLPFMPMVGLSEG
jgi:predicted AlkP superfamily phosphohydrolase/phosphomutase